MSPSGCFSFVLREASVPAATVWCRDGSNRDRKPPGLPAAGNKARGTGQLQLPERERRKERREPEKEDPNFYA